MATDSQFRADLEAGPELALARRGLVLSELELKALKRVRSLVQSQGVDLSKVPQVDWWGSILFQSAPGDVG